MDTQTYDARVRNALQTVVARHMGLSPPAGPGDLTLTDASIAATIFDFSFVTAFDLWVAALIEKARDLMKSENSTFTTFNYNGKSYCLRAYEVEEDDEWRDRDAGFYVSVGLIQERSTNFHATDLETAITRLAEVVRRNDICALCDRLLYGELELYCKNCKTHFNEPGCRECLCPFGRLEEDGTHPACKKRRLD